MHSILVQKFEVYCQCGEQLEAHVEYFGEVKLPQVIVENCGVCCHKEKVLYDSGQHVSNIKFTPE